MAITLAGLSAAAMAALIAKEGIDYIPGFPLKAKERKEFELVGRKIGLEEAMLESSKEARKMQYKETKASTQRMLDMMMRLRGEERTERIMTGSAERQMALVINAIQAMGAGQAGTMRVPRSSRPPASLIGALRGY